MARNSLRTTLLWGAGLSIALPALVLVVFQATSRYTLLVDQRVREPLQQYAEVLTTSMATALWTMDSTMAGDLVEAVMRDPDVVDVTVLDEFGMRLSSRHRPAPYQATLLEESRKVFHKGTPVGQVNVRISTDRVRRDILVVLGFQAAALLAQVALSFLFVWLLLDRRLIRPLGQLLQGVSQIARGDLGRPIQDQGTGEIGELARGLETMRTELATLIAERAEAEARLQSQTAQLRTLFDTLPDLVWLKSPDGVYLACNSRFEQFFGAAEPAILGKTDYDFVDRAQADFFRENDRRALAAGVPTRNEEEVTFAVDGHHEHLETVKTPVRGKDGEVFGILGIGRNITERLRAEEEKMRLQSQLLQSQKMESLGILAGGVAHDMNNVLGAIQVLASAHRSSFPGEEASKRAFDTISRAAERGSKMVQRLLGFARQSPTEEGDLDLNVLIREQTALLGQTTLSKVQIETSLAPDLCPVRGDENALANAVMNLCVNALDAMPESGVLRFTTRNLPAGRVEVRIEDTGTGMSPEVLEKAFDPFYTTKPMGKGTGLGLSMVYATVKAHNGTITLDSAPGGGTTVTMVFPALSPGAANPVRPRDLNPTTATPGLRILLVDDDPLIRETVQEILALLGHRVTPAASGEAALGLLDEGLPADLIILDMNMPGLGGEGTLPRLKALRPQVPVLLSTGKPDQATLDLASRYPGVTLLPKPFDLEELQAKVNRTQDHP